MPYVLTVDQRGSRRGQDRVDAVLRLLAERCPAPRLPFERTAGDEFQGTFEDADAVVACVRELLRCGGWSIGIGVGPVEEPLPASTRQARGVAFVRARHAVGVAKRRSEGVAVRGGDEAAAGDAEALIELLAALLVRRSGAAWQAVELVESGLTATEAAAKLGVSRQAVGQRLSAAHWDAERRCLPAAARLLRRVEGAEAL